MALLDIRDLTIVFGGLRAVSRFNLQVEEGEVVGIIGPNGAGKTTVFNMISGIYRPTRGSIFFQGKNLIGLLPPQVSAAGIARTFQNLRLFSTMSVLDNIKVACHSRVRYGVKDSFLWSRKFKKEEVLIEEKARSLVEMFRLKGREHDPGFSASLRGAEAPGNGEGLGYRAENAFIGRACRGDEPQRATRPGRAAQMG